MDHHRIYGARAAILAATLLFCAPLIGCARGQAAEDGRVTIRCSVWGKVQEARIWQEMADAFNRSQNRIRVRIQLITGVNYHYKVLAMTVGRSAPDVLACDDEQFHMLAANGLYEDLTPYIQRDFKHRFEEELYPAFRDAWERNGRFYALSYLGNCLLIFYNRDLRKEAGLPPDPDPNWTWADFDRAAIKQTRDLNKDGRTDQFGLARLSWFYCMQWIWSAGGTDMDPQMTRYMFDTAEARRGFQFHYNHMHKYRVTPLLSDLPNMNVEAQFFTGKVAMVVNGPWWIAQVRQVKDLDWDVAPMPIGPVRRATRATSEALAISPQSKHKEEGWEWIKFVLSDEGQRLIARAGRGVPAVKRIAEETVPDPSTPQHEERFLEALEKYSRRSLLHEHWVACEQQVFNPAWDRVVAGELDVDGFIRYTLPRAHEIMHGDDL